MSGARDQHSEEGGCHREASVHKGRWVKLCVVKIPLVAGVQHPQPGDGGSDEG